MKVNIYLTSENKINNMFDVKLEYMFDINNINRFENIKFTNSFIDIQTRIRKILNQPLAIVKINNLKTIEKQLIKIVEPGFATHNVSHTFGYGYVNTCLFYNIEK